MGKSHAFLVVCLCLKVPPQSFLFPIGLIRLETNPCSILSHLMQSFMEPGGSDFQTLSFLWVRTNPRGLFTRFRTSRKLVAAAFLIFQSRKLNVPTRCDLQGQGLAPCQHFFRCADSVPLSHLSFNFRDSDSYLAKLRLVDRSTNHSKMIAGRPSALRHRPAFRLLTKPHPCLLVPLPFAPKNKELNTLASHAFLKLFESPCTPIITEAT